MGFKYESSNRICRVQIVNFFHRFVCFSNNSFVNAQKDSLDYQGKLSYTVRPCMPQVKKNIA